MTEFAAIATLVANAATFLSVVVLLLQGRSGRRVARGQLINDLEKEFAGFHADFARLKPGGEWEELTEMSAEDIARLENIASFCEKLMHFVDCGIIPMKVLDRLFRNRFFIIVENKNVKKHVVESCYADWQDLRRLYEKWESLRA